MEYQDRKRLHETLSQKFNTFVIVGDAPVVSPTHFGEICRAMLPVLNCYLISFSNPFYGEGCQLCGSEATFIKNETTDEIKSLFEKFEHSSEYFDERDDGYENFLYEILKLVLDLLDSDQNKPTYKEFDSLETEWDQHQCERCNHLFEEKDCSHNPNGDLLCSACKYEDDLERES